MARVKRPFNHPDVQRSIRERRRQAQERITESADERSRSTAGTEETSPRATNRAKALLEASESSFDKDSDSTESLEQSKSIAKNFQTPSSRCFTSSTSSSPASAVPISIDRSESRRPTLAPGQDPELSDKRAAFIERVAIQKQRKKRAPPRFRCKACQKTLTGLKQRQEHFAGGPHKRATERESDKKADLYCYICKREFVSSHDYNNHIKGGKHLANRKKNH